jgi:hypothetical protein
VGKIDPEVFKSINFRYTETRAKLQNEQIQLKSQSNNEVGETFSKGVSVVKGLQRVMASANPTDKSLVVGTIFPEKLFFGNGKYRTSYANSFISLICSIDNEFGTKKMSKKLFLTTCHFGSPSWA